MKVWYVTKAGRISRRQNGLGNDGGVVNHIIISEDKIPHHDDEALCGTWPSIQWNNHWTEEPTGRICKICERRADK